MSLCVCVKGLSFHLSLWIIHCRACLMLLLLRLLLRLLMLQHHHSPPFHPKSDKNSTQQIGLFNGWGYICSLHMHARRTRMRPFHTCAQHRQFYFYKRAYASTFPALLWKVPSLTKHHPSQRGPLHKADGVRLTYSRLKIPRTPGASPQTDLQQGRARTFFARQWTRQLPPDVWLCAYITPWCGRYRPGSSISGNFTTLKSYVRPNVSKVFFLVTL